MKTFFTSLFIFLVVVSGWAAEEEFSLRDAERIYKERIARSPSDHQALTNLGIVYWEEGKRKNAIRSFRKAIKLNPQGDLPYYYIGEAYFSERKSEKAIKYFKDFRKRLPDISSLDTEDFNYYISILQDLGYRYTTLKEYNSAANVFKKIIKLDPKNQRARYNLAVCYYIHFNKRAKAYQELKKVIEIDPQSRTAAKAEFYIDYMRRNPDSRIIGDFTFMEEG